MQISAVAKEINEWSGSVLIAGILEGTIKNQINLFKPIIKDTFLSNAIALGEKSPRFPIGVPTT